MCGEIYIHKSKYRLKKKPSEHATKNLYIWKWQKNAKTKSLIA